MTQQVVGASGVPVTVPSVSDIPASVTPGTASQIQVGTDTVARTWSAKIIHDEIARQIAAIPAA
ncbi:Uncharacterised protein [Yersinia frederiksenii]|nr:Uncharacterised protein [Yersinia frederiksenii]